MQGDPAGDIEFLHRSWDIVFDMDRYNAYRYTKVIARLL